MTRETRLDRRTLLQGTGVTILASGLAGCGEPSEEEDDDGGEGDDGGGEGGGGEDDEAEEEGEEQLQGPESA